MAFSCLPRESGQFAPPSVVSLTSENEGREAVMLRCCLSDARVESCGFIYSAEGAEHRVECTLEEKSFDARLTGLVQGVVYSWCAYYSAGGTELRSEQGVFRLTADTDPIPVEDPAFMDYLIQHYDSDGNGEISIEEAEAIKEIRMDPTNEYNLQSLSGIEYMPNLEVISCPGEWYSTDDKTTGVPREHYYVGPYKDVWDYAWGPIGTLKYIDVSNNPKLRELDVRQNSALGVEVGTIDLSNNKALEVLNLDFTWLEYPDISENTELRVIRFCHLRGEIPDITSHTKAVNINIDFPLNQRTEIHDFDVSGMPDLESLELRGIVRNISNLSENKKLRYVSIAHSNHFSGELNVSGCQELEGLQCMCSNISSLDLSNNTKLKDLACELNHLTELDLSANTQLEELECRGNMIATLDVSFNPLLKRLSCVQKNRPDGTNYLKTLYISEGQSIPYVTVNRDIDHIPEETEIVELSLPSLGEIIESGSTGIVAAVTDSGREVLLMSVDEIHDRPWQESWNWCEGHGAGWRMPTIDELTAIQPNFDFLNEKLRAAGFAPLTEENKCYWSCTPYEIAGYYYRERLWDGSIWYYGFDEWHECYANYTRAVKTISL